MHSIDAVAIDAYMLAKTRNGLIVSFAMLLEQSVL
jgi:hypothetical protein